MLGDLDTMQQWFIASGKAESPNLNKSAPIYINLTGLMAFNCLSRFRVFGQI